MKFLLHRRVMILLTILAVNAALVVTVFARSEESKATPRLTTTTRTGSTAPYQFFPSTMSKPTAGDETHPLAMAGVADLQTATGNGVQISYSRATGVARFIRPTADHPNSLAELVDRSAAPEAQAQAFLAQYGSAFGLTDPASQLTLAGVERDALATRVVYHQVYQGVPVFGGILYAHFDAEGNLRAVNGSIVPDIAVAVTPRLAATDAEATALNAVASDAPRLFDADYGQRSAVSRDSLRAKSNTLYVYRLGMDQGVRGPSHLVYGLEVSNDRDVREFVYIDALTGKIVDRYSGVHENLNREVYEPNPDPANLKWKEGDTLPFSGTTAQQTEDINNLIIATGESYGIFNRLFGRDSYNGAGATMKTVNNDPRITCPNANWNGTTTNYCTGVTSDDVVAHEWGHAYTEYTHNLVYRWQPGALNEAYSDIWGESVDMVNGRQTDSPLTNRTAGACTAYTRPRAIFTVNSPAGLAGDYPAGTAAFGPAITITGTMGLLVLGNDGVGVIGPNNGTNQTTSDGCEPLNDMTGKIALLYRGTCGFAVKTKNAQNAGAIGVVIANHSAGGNNPPGMAGVDPTIIIPTLSVGNNQGLVLEGQLRNNPTTPVTVTLHSSAPGADDSYRWLMGEDSSAFGGAIRDMWNPNCYNHPAKVTDSYYHCTTDDSGGVHRNSGVINHGFALLVDGGTFNGQTIAALGLTKTLPIYFRAQTVYQVWNSDFPDHADALEQSCNNLVGQTLRDPATGLTSTAMLVAGDCAEVTKMIAAVELRTAPTQCNFQPLLGQTPPALCSAGAMNTVLSETVELTSTTGWTMTHTDVYSATNVEWVRQGNLPGSRAGFAFFGADPDNYGDCSGDIGDVSRVMYLTSPAVTLPMTVTAPRLAFDHYIATEANFDGGTLYISVNGGAWTQIMRPDFAYNPYNGPMATVAGGNTSPLAGLDGFHGSDGGKVIGTWGRSIVYLSNYARPGDVVQLRFAQGSDGCGGLDGWYLDDIQMYSCSSERHATFAAASTTVQENAGTVNLTVTLSAAAAVTTTVNYTVGLGTAMGGGVDYTFAPGALIFNVGETSKPLSVMVTDDALYEITETVSIVLVNNSAGSVGTPAVLNVVDNDSAALPAVSFGAASQTVAEGGATVMIPVMLDKPSGANTTLNFTVGGNATLTTRNTDFAYAPTSGSLAMAPGFTSTVIQFAARRDSWNDPNETVIFMLTNPSGAALGAQTAHTVTIQDMPTTISFGYSIGPVAPTRTVTYTAQLMSNGGPVANENVFFSDGTFAATLSSANEVPTNTSAGTGSLQFTYNPTSRVLSYNGTVAGLTGAPTAAHIHYGAAGVTGTVLVGLDMVPSGNGATFSGVYTLPAGVHFDLVSGALYVNVHTAANPNGEVRGQISGTTARVSNTSGVASVTRTYTTNGTRTLSLFAGDQAPSAMAYVWPYIVYLPAVISP